MMMAATHNELPGLACWWLHFVTSFRNGILEHGRIFRFCPPGAQGIVLQIYYCTVGTRTQLSSTLIATVYLVSHKKY